MTSIILAAVKTKGYEPFYLAMDEDGSLYFTACNGTGKKFPVMECHSKPAPASISYYVAYKALLDMQGDAAVFPLMDFRKKAMEAVAHSQKGGDAVLKLILIGAFAHEIAKPVKSRDDEKRRVSMEIRILPRIVKKPDENSMALIAGAVEDMGKLTPREMAQMFPAEKRYDGGGNFKDYFTSTKFLNALEDKPLGTEGALKFLWDYMSPELNQFYLLVMEAVDNDRKRQGKPSMGEEFARENGIPVYHKTTDADGSPILMDEKGNTIPIDEEKNHD